MSDTQQGQSDTQEIIRKGEGQELQQGSAAGDVAASGRPGQPGGLAAPADTATNMLANTAGMVQVNVLSVQT